MQITGPYTPTAGTPIQVNDPAQFTAANVACQIQNESDFPLIAVIGGGLNSVAPFTAETITTGKAPLLVMTPQSGGTTGEITLVWLLEGEASPVPDGPLTGTTTIVRGGGSVAFYPSLTGPGESATPGDLTQAGALIIDVPAANLLGLQVNDNSSIGSRIVANSISLFGSSGTVQVSLFVTIQGGPGGGVTIGQNPGGVNNIKIGSATDLLAFFGKSPDVGPQISGGTLAGVIAGLVALGLFSS